MLMYSNDYTNIFNSLKLNTIFYIITSRNKFSWAKLNTIRIIVVEYNKKKTAVSVSVNFLLRESYLFMYFFFFLNNLWENYSNRMIWCRIYTTKRFGENYFLHGVCQTLKPSEKIELSINITNRSHYSK